MVAVGLSSAAADDVDAAAPTEQQQAGQGGGGSSGKPAGTGKAKAGGGKEQQPYKMVRTDATMGNLRGFLYTPEALAYDGAGSQQQPPPPPSQSAASAGGSSGGGGGGKRARSSGGDGEVVEDVRDRGAVPLVSVGDEEGEDGAGAGAATKDRHYRRRLPSIVETRCQYLSVRALIADIHDRCHQ